jgi:hypothetical protein
MVIYSCKKCGELNFLTPHAFWNISDFGAKCERCETINTITLEDGELKKTENFKKIINSLSKPIYFFCRPQLLSRDKCIKNKILPFIINCSQVMTLRKGLLFLVMGVIVLFLASNFTSSNPTIATTLPNPLEELFLPSHLFPLATADHGQEVSIMLNSAQFIPLTTGEGNQVNVLLNYRVNDPSTINSQINSVMKVYWPNRTLFKTSSSPEGFIVNETGTQRHATTITNGKLVDPTAVVQFTNLAKTVPISNPVQIRLNLHQPSASATTATTTQGVTSEIAALPP